MSKEIFLLFLTLVLITAFEFSVLTSMALWHDEAFSVLLTKYSFQEMIYRTGLDVHPPFYYILLKIWTGFLGYSLFILRLFSVFFGFLASISMFLLVKEIFNDRKFALFASVLLAFNSFFMQFVTEARMFTLGIFLVIISSFLLIKSLRSKNWLWWILYALSASLGIYTHYYIFFSILAQGLFLIYWIFREHKFNFLLWLADKNFKLGGLAYLLILISFLPWLKTFLSQFGQVEQSYWIPPMNFSSIPSTFLKMTTGGSIDVFKFWYVLVLLMAVVFIAAVYFLKKTKTPFKWFVIIMTVIPFVGASFLSLKSSIYLDRYFIFTLPFYIIIVSGTIWLLKTNRLKYFLVAIAILGSLIAFPARWEKLDTTKKPGMFGASSYVNQQARPNDKIYVGSSFVYFTFKYYNKTEIYPLLYSPGQLSHFSGTALLSEKDLIKNFNQAQKNDVVWMINTTGFGNYQPAVPANWTKTEEKGFQDVYDYRGWIIVTKYQVQ